MRVQLRFKLKRAASKNPAHAEASLIFNDHSKAGEISRRIVSGFGMYPFRARRGLGKVEVLAAPETRSAVVKRRDDDGIIRAPGLLV